LIENGSENSGETLKITLMASKKKYYQLDDIGFLGVAETRSAAAIQRDRYRTSEFIKKYRAGVISSVKESAIVIHHPKKTAKFKTTTSSASKKQYAHSK
jgi:hypothetical protein